MRKWMITMLLTLCCLLGCGKQQGNGVTEPEEKEPARDYVAEYQSQEEKEPYAIEWKALDAENAESYYRQEKYIAPLMEAQPDNAWLFDGVGFESFYYTGFSVYEDGACQGFWVDELNLESLETRRIPYPGERGAPSSLDYDGEKLYGVFETMDEEGFIDSSVMTQLLPDGSFGESIDLYAVAKEKGILPKQARFAFQKTVHYYPEKEAVYLIPYSGEALYVIGTDGKLKYEFTGFGEGSSTISLYAYTKRGDAIFVAFDKTTRESTFFMYEKEGAVKELFTQPGEVSRFSQSLASCDAYGNILYLENQTNIVNWNVETGKKERLYCGSQDAFRELKFITRTKEGKYILLSDDIEGMSLCLYSASGPAVQAEIRIETCMRFDQFFKAKLQKFERTHPGVTFLYGEELTNYDEYDLNMNKLYQEFIDGTGPDLILLGPDEIERFVKNGVFLDMSDFIDEKELCILPGILESGQIDGKQYLFPLSAEVRPVLVKKSVWDKPGWTVEEALKLWEEQQKQGGEDFLLLGPNERYWMLLYFFIANLEDSPFIDIQNKTCDFDGELFRRVLEVCKREDQKIQSMGDVGYQDENANRKAIKEGKQLLVRPHMFSFSVFSAYQAELEDDCNWVGFPTESGNGNMIIGGQGLAVNSNTEHADIIKELINCLYSYDYLTEDLTYTVPLRSDILEKTVVEKSDWTEDILIRLGKRSYCPVAWKKKDGTSYKKEYMDYLTSCRADDSTYDELLSIIQEEAEPYFLDQKSVTAVQKLIQNRVTLFLSER